MQNSDRKQSISKKFLSSKEPRLVTYYISIAVDIILLYFFNNIVFANIIFLSSKNLTNCLWAINLALAAGIVGNFIFLLFRPRWFRHLIRAVLYTLALLAVYVIYRVFPFIFSADIFRTVTRIVLVIIMAGTGIGVVLEVIKFGVTWIHRQPPAGLLISPVTPPQVGSPASQFSPESSPEPPASVSPSLPEAPAAPPASSLPPEPPRPE
jgi:hypothetical protein